MQRKAIVVLFVLRKVLNIIPGTKFEVLDMNQNEPKTFVYAKENICICLNGLTVFLNLTVICSEYNFVVNRIPHIYVLNGISTKEKHLYFKTKQNEKQHIFHYTLILK